MSEPSDAELAPQEAAGSLPALPSGSSSSTRVGATAIDRWLEVALRTHATPDDRERRPKVLAVEVAKSRVAATVRFQRRGEIEVEVEALPLTEAAWRIVAEVFAAHTLFVARLLAGRLDDAFVAKLSESGVVLLPDVAAGMQVRCGCEAPSGCEHRGALLTLLAEEIERDPFVLFLLRGRERSEVLALLGGEDEPIAPVVEGQPIAGAEPLPADPETFWSVAPRDPVHLGEVKEPEVPAVLVRRLGEFPFWRGTRSLLPALEAVYRRASKAALELLKG